MLSYLPDVADASRTPGSRDTGTPAGTVVVRAARPAGSRRGDGYGGERGMPAAGELGEPRAQYNVWPGRHGSGRKPRIKSLPKPKPSSSWFTRVRCAAQADGAYRYERGCTRMNCN